MIDLNSKESRYDAVIREFGSVDNFLDEINEIQAVSTSFNGEKEPVDIRYHYEHTPNDRNQKDIKKMSYSIKELIAELTAMQEIIGEDAEVFRLECGYELSIKEVSVKWFNGGDSVIID